MGDIVWDVDRPKRGRGVVIEDRSASCSPTVGQKLTIDFEQAGLYYSDAANCEIGRLRLAVMKLD